MFGQMCSEIWVGNRLVRDIYRASLLHSLGAYRSLDMSAGKRMEIVGADFINGRHLIVEFSDGTSTVYSIEQLREIRQTKSVRANSGLLELEPISS